MKTLDKHLYKKLYNYCNDNEAEKVKTFLEANPNFDLLSKDEWDGEAIFFDLAFSRDSVTILDLLLKHYESTKLRRGHDAIEYKVARSKLINILVKNQSRAKSELQELIKPYTKYCKENDSLKSSQADNNESIKSDELLKKNKQDLAFMHNLCRWNMPNRIEELLEKDRAEPLDLTDENGDLFEIAIINEHTEIVRLLLDYYVRIHRLDREVDEANIELSNMEQHNQCYKIRMAEHHLSSIIQNIIDMGTKISPSVQALIKPHIKTQDDADSDHEQYECHGDDKLLSDFKSICENSGMSLVGTSTEKYFPSDVNP